MTKCRKTDTTLLRLLRDRAGNFAITTAAVIPLILFGGGVAIDLSQMQLNKNKLQDATDAAALATASQLAKGKLDKTGAEKFALDFISAQMQTDATYFGDDELKPQVDITEATGASGQKKYTVKIDSKYQQEFNALTKLFGHSSATLQARGVTESTGGDTQVAMSMYLALDQSGSMKFITGEEDESQNKCNNYTKEKWPNVAFTKPCYIKKIDALKAAAGILFDELDKIDPKSELVRTGVATYSHELKETSPMGWGTSSSRDAVGRMIAWNGTDATKAMEVAVPALLSGSEEQAHAQKGSSDVKKYLLLMTDGENTGNSSTHNPALDVKTLAFCAEAKAKNVVIYTVAFMAPPNGKKLLESCASTTKNYYEADEMGQLIAAFQNIAKEAVKETVRLTN